MRLIDADAINFEEVFGGKSDFVKDTREAAKILIDKQPTAFDKEKVIWKLIELRNAEARKPYSPHSYEEAQKQGRYSAFSESIIIVEKGGIE